MTFEAKIAQLEEEAEQKIDEDGWPTGLVHVPPGFMLEIVAALRSEKKQS